MELSRIVTALRRAGPSRRPPAYVPARADERPGDDPGGSVIAARAVLLLLLAATVIDGTVRVGGAAPDSSAAWPDRGGDVLRPR
jgi:hypothetical protein